MWSVRDGQDSRDRLDASKRIKDWLLQMDPLLVHSHGPTTLSSTSTEIESVQAD